MVPAKNANKRTTGIKAMIVSVGIVFSNIVEKSLAPGAYAAFDFSQCKSAEGKLRPL